MISPLGSLLTPPPSTRKKAYALQQQSCSQSDRSDDKLLSSTHLKAEITPSDLLAEVMTNLEEQGYILASRDNWKLLPLVLAMAVCLAWALSCTREGFALHPEHTSVVITQR